MKAIQSLGWYYPESTGGTETYVRGLTKSLRDLGIESCITAPANQCGELSYTWEETPVFRYPVTGPFPPPVLRGEEPPQGFHVFKDWLDQQEATLYHQHSVTTGCGLHHLQAAKSRGMTTILTIHVPSPVCMRSTMLLGGRESCDGHIDEFRCAQCWLQSKGVGRAGSRILGSIPPGIGELFLRHGKFGTALGATKLVQQHRDQLLTMVESADRVVSVCQWLFDALLLNGVPQRKLSLIRHGVPPVSLNKRRAPRSQNPHPLVIGFLGRWDSVKGLEFLIEVIQGLPNEVPVELQIHASNPRQGIAERLHATVKEVAQLDSRIHLLPSLSAELVPEFLASIDILAVPSQGFETGPLVVLEAFDVGTPVLGSDLGGIAELVEDDRNGVLVSHSDHSAWREAILRLLNPELMNQLRRGIDPVRSTMNVATDTLALYRNAVELAHTPA